MQGRGSHSFKIEAGFKDDKSKKLVPAILKRMFDTKWKDDPDSLALQEIELLDRVGYFSSE